MSERKNPSVYMLAISLAAAALWNTAQPLWSQVSLNDASWGVYGWFSVISAWGMPLLIAGTGCRYLTDTPTLSSGFVLKKRLPRALTGCVVWWLVSALTLMKYTRPDELDADTFFEALATVLETPYYVKFLLLVVALFAFYPLLKRIADQQRLAGYAAAAFAVMSVVVPILRYIPYLRYVYLFAVQINWNFFTEFGLYLFLGVWLSRKTFAWHHRVLIYCAGILATVAMYSCTVWTYSAETGMDAAFISEASPFTVLQVTAITVLIVSLSGRSKRPRAGWIWNAAAQCAYAFVPLCAIMLHVFGKLLPAGSLSPALSVPITAGAALLSALAFGALIRRLPVFSYFSI